MRCCEITTAAPVFFPPAASANFPFPLSPALEMKRTSYITLYDAIIFKHTNDKYQPIESILETLRIYFIVFLPVTPPVLFFKPNSRRYWIECGLA